MAQSHISVPHSPFVIEDPVLIWSENAEDESHLRDQLGAWRKAIQAQLDTHKYEDEDRKWYQRAWHEAFVFIYDAGFYDRSTGRYRIEELIDDGEREFGGYDVLLLWQSYPRLGIDRRNQFDLYRDMPGGLPALKDLVDRAHQRNVKVFLNYNPWDIGTRREAVTDGEALGQIVAAIGADGVFLDTMSSMDDSFREALEAAVPHIVFDPEGLPPTSELQRITGGWLQRNPPLAPPQLPTIRWLEPRFIYRGIIRQAVHRADLLHSCLFYGCGQIIWENVFGFWNPWLPEDRAFQRKAVRILRMHGDAFRDPDWQPFVETLVQGVYANRWTAGSKTVFTLLNATAKAVDDFVLRLPRAPGRCFYNLLDNERIEPVEDSVWTHVKLRIPPKQATCVVVLPSGAPSPLIEVVEPISVENHFRNQVTVAAHLPRLVATTPLAAKNQRVKGMCYVPGGRFVMHVRHNVQPCIEGACYGSQENHRDKRHAPQYFWLDPFHIDGTEVTNAQYKAFLTETHYLPSDLTGFLKLWKRPRGTDAMPWLWEYPEHKADHPVVYVDLDDARSYARWVGKRLPREEEWQLAAQGTDRRPWPWGGEPGNPGEPDLTKCNSNSAGTTPVDAYPGGASPYGVLDMAGNVWEWTESERDDGHTRYAIIRGGSFAVVTGSQWYTASGAQPCDCHEKMLLMYSGLDRCDTIGFRCVKDAES